jgi:hypothetical protein
MVTTVWLGEALADVDVDVDRVGTGVLDAGGEPVVTAPEPVPADDEHAVSAGPSTARVSAAAMSAAERVRRVRAMPVMMPGGAALRSIAGDDRRRVRLEP